MPKDTCKFPHLKDLMFCVNGKTPTVVQLDPNLTSDFIGLTPLLVEYPYAPHWTIQTRYFKEYCQSMKPVSKEEFDKVYKSRYVY